MSRRHRKGRPRRAIAKRRATTAAGRAPEPDPGSPELLLHRVAVTGSAALPDDLLGVLFGRAVIDADAYAAGREFSALVRLVRLGLGLTEASAAGTWRNIVAATGGGRVMAGELGYPGAERARHALVRFRRDLGQAAWQAVSDAADNIWPAADFAAFVLDLRSGLYYLAPRLPLSRRDSA